MVMMNSRLLKSAVTTQVAPNCCISIWFLLNNRMLFIIIKDKLNFLMPFFEELCFKEIKLHPSYLLLEIIQKNNGIEKFQYKNY